MMTYWHISPLRAVLIEQLFVLNFLNFLGGVGAIIFSPIFSCFFPQKSLDASSSRFFGPVKITNCDRTPPYLDTYKIHKSRKSGTSGKKVSPIRTAVTTAETCCMIYMIASTAEEIGDTVVLECESYARYWNGIRIHITRGASPRRADARLGFADGPNYRGCRQIEAVNATLLPRGTLKLNRVWTKRKKHCNQIQ